MMENKKTEQIPACNEQSRRPRLTLGRLFQTTLNELHKQPKLSLPSPNYNDKEETSNLVKKQNSPERHPQIRNGYRKSHSVHGYDKTSNRFRINHNKEENFQLNNQIKQNGSRPNYNGTMYHSSRSPGFVKKTGFIPHAKRYSNNDSQNFKFNNRNYNEGELSKSKDDQYNNYNSRSCNKRRGGGTKLPTSISRQQHPCHTNHTELKDSCDLTIRIENPLSVHGHCESETLSETSHLSISSHLSSNSLSGELSSWKTLDSENALEETHDELENIRNLSVSESSDSVFTSSELPEQYNKPLCDQITVTFNTASDSKEVKFTNKSEIGEFQIKCELPENGTEALLDKSPNQHEQVIESKRPSPEQVKAISICLKEIYDNKHVPNEDIKSYEEQLKRFSYEIQAHLYGSLKSGFAMTDSDVNINLMSKSFQNAKSANLLVAFYQDLKRKDYIIKLEKNMEHKPPYISFEVKYLDLQWKAQQNEQTACCTSDLLRRYTNFDERVRILGIAFKYWGKICDIADEEDGTLRSLCFPLMLIHFFQQCEPPVLPVITEQSPYIRWTSENKKEIGELWLELLHYYSNKFSWTEFVVTIKHKRPVTKSEKCWETDPIAIEEPTKCTMNVAKPVVNASVVEFIKMCFKSTYAYFSKPRWSYQNSASPSTVNQPDSTFEELENSSGSENQVDDYTFNDVNFTGGKLVPVYCSSCDKDGHCEEECPTNSCSKLPVLPSMTPIFQKGVDNFCIEIYRRYHFQPEEEEKRISLLNELTASIKRCSYFKDASLDLFGSSSNGFGFADSDMDICMTVDVKNKCKVLNQKQYLRFLANVLRKNSKFRSIFLIADAKIPIVKFIHRGSGLKGDISMGNTLGIYNSQLINTYAKIDPRFKYLGYTIKAFARNSKISEYSTRGLTSYALLLMVIHFLQQREPPVLPVLQELQCPEKTETRVDGWDVWFYSSVDKLHTVWQLPEMNKETVGQLCLRFFLYYVEQFDWKNTVVSIRQKKPLSVLVKGWHSNFICIEDPFKLDDNLGGRVNALVGAKIMKAFQTARKLFGTPVEHSNLRDYLLDPRVLSESKQYRDSRCRNCGLIGHMMKFCPHRKFHWE